MRSPRGGSLSIVSTTSRSNDRASITERPRPSARPSVRLCYCCCCCRRGDQETRQEGREPVRGTGARTGQRLPSPVQVAAPVPCTGRRLPSPVQVAAPVPVQSCTDYGSVI